MVTADNPQVDTALSLLKQAIEAEHDRRAAFALGDKLFEECERRSWLTVHEEAGATFGHFTAAVSCSRQTVLKVPEMGWDFEAGVMP